jgi:hypothetical protein
VNDADRLNKIKRVWPQVFKEGASRLRPVALDVQGNLTVLCASEKLADDLVADTSKLIDKLGELTEYKLSVQTVNAIHGADALFWLAESLEKLRERVEESEPG